MGDELFNNLVAQFVGLVNRVQKVLEEAGIKLGTILSDVMDVSGQAILRALCEGECDPQHLIPLLHRNVQAKPEQAVAALTGEVGAHHQFLLRACKKIES